MKRLALFVLLAACGSKSPSPTTTPDKGAAEPTATAVLPDVPFDSLDHEQKIAFMKQKVMPAMEPLFKGHDATKYAEFGCKTCHGEGAEAGHFDMPNAKLPVLDFDDMSTFKKEDIEWMGKEIKPAMAALLKLPEMTKENPKGFGCLGCHTMKTP